MLGGNVSKPHSREGPQESSSNDLRPVEHAMEIMSPPTPRLEFILITFGKHKGSCPKNEFCNDTARNPLYGNIELAEGVPVQHNVKEKPKPLPSRATPPC